ncbi:efflux RND transporter permease subunit [Rubrobacter aplysinae]|uniref:efflux RND transporter permease subunit n=1 Tax=Rubrobacter aplysinae TaxID=909625 RepID=UPI00069DB999|nr:efflux RND transporter permease subunit [Rubrobacter aplysinae]
MSRIVSWCLGNKSVVMLAVVLLIGGGGYAATQLNQELLPDVEFPFVTVQTAVPGAGPDVVDEQVTQSIEDAVEGVSGIEGIESNSTQGFSLVNVEFGFDTTPEEAEEDLQSALEGVELPEQAASPEVATQSADSLPVVNLSLEAGDRSLTELTRYAEDEVIPGLEEVEGVSSASLLGGSGEQISVRLDTEKLEEKGVPPEAVVGAISGAGGSTPVGEVVVDGASAPVVTETGLGGIEALRELPVGGAAAAAPTGGAPSGASGSGGSPEGATGGAPPSGGSSGGAPSGAAPSGAPSGEAPEPVLLEDVAEVSQSEENLAGISRTDGEPSIGLSVIKEQEANTVEVAEGVREELGGVRDELGDDGVNVVFDTSEDVEESVSGLVEKALLGAAFAIAVIFIFLRSVRATLVTAVSLPTSVLAALLFSWGEGLTLNILTLAGLTIAIGRVVDDAIVVLENAYRYIQEEGLDPDEAALRGTSEVASAITSSTLCTVAVFLPLGLVGGIVSEFFLPLSLTVAFALIASLIVSVTIIPVLVSLFIKRRGVPQNTAQDPQNSGEQRQGLLVRLYTPVLRWGLGHRAIVLVVAGVLFAGGLGAAFLLPTSFFPPSESQTVIADVELEDGSSLQESSEQVRPFEDFLLDDGGVESYQLSVGGESAQGQPGARPDDQAQAFISVAEDADVDSTLERVQERGEELFGGGFQAQVQEQGPPAGGLAVSVTGGSEEERAVASEKIVDEISGVSGLENVQTDATGGGRQISVDVNPQDAARAGVSPSAVSQSLATYISGGGSDLSITGDTPVSVGVPADRVDSVDDVESLPVGAAGASVADVADVEQSEAPSAISRTDGEAGVTVSGDISGGDTNAVSTAVEERVGNLELANGVEASVGGESEDIAESFNRLFISIGVALAAVFLILVVFFSSLLLPLVILLAVPLTTIGAFGALLITDTALSLPSLLGVLLLIGIVVANSILLIDFVVKARGRHDNVTEAIVEAGRARLRPILMTALVTIFALLPLALGFGGGAVLISNSLAIPVIGGLLTSTFLTLLVVPVGYSVLEGGRDRARWRREKRRLARLPKEEA